VDQGVAIAQQALNFLKQKDPNWNPSQPNGGYWYPRQMTEHISWSIVPFKKQESPYSPASPGSTASWSSASSICVNRGLAHRGMLIFVIAGRPATLLRLD
jgi:hypothetical protein